MMQNKALNMSSRIAVLVPQHFLSVLLQHHSNKGGVILFKIVKHIALSYFAILKLSPAGST
jgi:hypothetical protein